MSDLPKEVRRDLDRAAEGVGRTPTSAHPDCACVIEVPALAWCEETNRYHVPVLARRITKESRASCPQHGPVPFWARQHDIPADPDDTDPWEQTDAG